MMTNEEGRRLLIDFAKEPTMERAEAIISTGALGFFQRLTKINVSDTSEEGKEMEALSRKEVGRLFAFFNVWTESQAQPSEHTRGQLEVIRLLSSHHDLQTRTAATSVLLGESLLSVEDFTISPYSKKDRRR